MQFIH